MIFRAVSSCCLSLLLLAAAASGTPEISVRFQKFPAGIPLFADSAHRANRPFFKPSPPEKGKKRTHKDSLSGGRTVFTFNVKEETAYRLLARVYWPSSASNSFWLKLDTLGFTIFGNTPQYKKWVTIPGPVWLLAPGRHTVTLAERESGARLRSLYLSPMRDYITSKAILKGRSLVFKRTKMLVRPCYTIQKEEGAEIRIFSPALHKAPEGKSVPLKISDRRGHTLFEGRLGPREEALVRFTDKRPGDLVIRAGKYMARYAWLHARYRRLIKWVRKIEKRAPRNPDADFWVNTLRFCADNIVQSRSYKPFDEGVDKSLPHVLWQFNLAERIANEILRGGSPRRYGQRLQVFKEGRRELPYWIFLPAQYADEDRPFPLLLFLHGADSRGKVKRTRRYGPPAVADKDPAFPFVLVSPVCPKKKFWTDALQLSWLERLVDRVVEKFRIDTARIYLTGGSMGGSGVWALAMDRPDRYAAIAPVCGIGDPQKACVIKDLPVWVFHGARDMTVPLKASEDMVDALKTCGSSVRFTVYPNAGHEAGMTAHADPALYDWFLTQHR